MIIIFMQERSMSLFKANRHCSCHAGKTIEAAGVKKIAIVGNPNVGKSIMFNALTGVYVTVSNYPGTTVEVSRGRGWINGQEFEVVDTPGMYSLLPITEEEQVARSLLFEEKPDVVIHVVDAKNLERMLPLTFQLIEAGFPLILDVNIIDEAERMGLKVDVQGLENELRIPVVATAAISKRGVGLLKERVVNILGAPGEIFGGTSIGGASRGMQAKEISYDISIESALKELEELLGRGYTLSKRAIALLILQEDPEILQRVTEREAENADLIQDVIRRVKDGHAHSLSYPIALRRRNEAKQILERILIPPEKDRKNFGEILSRAMINPITGIPIFAAVLYFGLYRFVGGFGAGTVVDFLEGVVFARYINPFITRIFESFIPWTLLRELFVGEFGVITLGLRYAVAIILPIVATFFIVFSVLEDSGYFPRLAMLVDRIFKKIGLNGRAVIPMILGFGCGTMATMVTRTLETKREKVIATILLALSVPCSAQLGVILAILSSNPKGLMLWGGVIAGIFLLVGFLSAKLMPGDQPYFYMELPPLRLPRLSNILVKTYSRVQWYLLEIIPIFLFVSFLIWAGKVSGLFQLVTRGLEPVMRWIGLPKETAYVFIFGFFRRDYGAAGLYDLQQAGLFSGRQLVVASVTLTLFIPCIAQLTVMFKERGWKAALGIMVFVFTFAFFMGFILNWSLTALGVQL